MKFLLVLLIVALVQCVFAEFELFPHYDDQALAEIRSIFVESGAEAMTEEELAAEDEAFDNLSTEAQDFVDEMDSIGHEELAAIYSTQNCNKVCPAGQRPFKNGKKPTANGCGPEGKSFIVKLFNKALGGIAPPAFTRCCASHDIGYGTCTTSATGRQKADSAFLSCLTRAVASYKTRKNLTLTEKAAMKLSLHKVFYTAVAKFGCSPFKAGQEAACKCIK